jgi:hypothetical protein
MTFRTVTTIAPKYLSTGWAVNPCSEGYAVQPYGRTWCGRHFGPPLSVHAKRKDAEEKARALRRIWAPSWADVDAPHNHRTKPKELA